MACLLPQAFRRASEADTSCTRHPCGPSVKLFRFPFDSSTHRSYPPSWTEAASASSTPCRIKPATLIRISRRATPISGVCFDQISLHRITVRRQLFEPPQSEGACLPYPSTHLSSSSTALREAVLQTLEPHPQHLIGASTSTLTNCAHRKLERHLHFPVLFAPPRFSSYLQERSAAIALSPSTEKTVAQQLQRHSSARQPNPWTFQRIPHRASENIRCLHLLGKRPPAWICARDFLTSLRLVGASGMCF